MYETVLAHESVGPKVLFDEKNRVRYFYVYQTFWRIYFPCASEKSLPALVSQYESLRPCFEKITRLEALMERMEADLDNLEQQVTEAEATVERNR
jgi:DNA-binding transcriptional regulator GbsR (MarR family)